MSKTADVNRKIIEEFRQNEGKVGGFFEGSMLLILTTTGAKSGKTRENPLMYRADGDQYVVFASAAGSPKNPSWYYNAKANPDVTVEVGTERFAASATEITGEERKRVYAAQASDVPQFGQYEQESGRTIPVVALTRRD